MTDPTHHWGFDPDTPLKGASTCPHCRGMTRIEPDAEMRYVCAVCGGPRVRVLGDVTLSGREVEPLKRGDQQRKKRAGWRAAGGVSGAAATLLVVGGAFAKLALGAGIAAAGTAVVMALPLLLLMVWSMSRGRAAGAQLTAAVDRAWKSAARDVVAAAGRPLSAAQLGEALPLSRADSEALMAELAVDEALTSRIRDDGALVFSAPSDEPAGRRIALDDPLEAKFRALEAEQQAAASEEIDAQASERRRHRQDGSHER